MFVCSPPPRGLSRPPTHPRRRRRRSPPALAAAARCRRRPMPPPPPPLAARRSPLAGQFFCFAAAAAAAAAAQHMVELQLPRQSDGRWWRGAARGRPSRRRRGRVHTPAVAAHRARASSERGVAAAAAWQLSSLSASLSVARPRGRADDGVPAAAARPTRRVRASRAWPARTRAAAAAARAAAASLAAAEGARLRNTEVRSGLPLGPRCCCRLRSWRGCSAATARFSSTRTAMSRMARVSVSVEYIERTPARRRSVSARPV